MNYLKKNNSYYNPVKIIETDNWINEIKLIIASKKLNSSLLITSKGNNQRINIQKYFPNLVIVDNVPPNPTIQYCDSELKSLRSQNFDSIIAIGGGSVMDAAKLFLAGISIKEKSTIELIKYKKNIRTKVQTFFIPTTHGTGSEVTMWGTIWDLENKKKYSISNPDLYPNYALLDYKLTESLSINLSIITLMDALSHSLESIWNKNKNSKTIKYAIEAIILIINNTKDIHKKSISKENRKNLIYASTLAGLAFSNTKTAICHSISYPLTMLYNIPHGVASSMTLIPVLIQAENEIKDELQIIYDELKINNLSDFICIIKEIYSNQISYKLKDWGVKKEDIPLLVKKCYTKDRIENYIIDIKEEDMLKILQTIY
ncbi:MAG: alcohol dehydrogenase [Candidatus Marinimicrobia bacterium]|nr:alcohol dehydrogenase [Candidatus Neomarinimicrobiota bacterium]|tara:strand:- start:1438 stop:2556 length:1119 start_codon:yes stop_codon:yes gene_type:complete